ncbi:hypothetical protein RU820_05375 [Acidithiobacillus ferrooxidans]|uniref:Uncharacterized protein n=1 Tax=Acidithiobacillus ferrooxidans (strain ATCC 23270 / DSM 14882 / CIP 104768 / NCIMB 8455) TaxID=243159 RepID=B7J876_ACIF2|nr:hypothetical protein [Acidithiobacillus ferrooxidans]ACK78086.1 hypothetical protein AFE_1128 [Acidithiobacillus ferrooxidans ATCC 23270]
MGWKNVKDHYRITHIVQVVTDAICIGSPYVYNLIEISLDGRILKRYDERRNEHLERIMREMDADLDVLKRLVQAPDIFANSITVYTWEGAKILEKQCEVFGWPNVTHDGCLMYKNTFSLDKAEVISWAKISAERGVKNAQEVLNRHQKQLQESQEYLDACRLQLDALSADYPENE